MSEKAPCSVNALAACLGISYQEAHARLAALGRRHGCRFNLGAVLGALGLERHEELTCKRVETILPELSQGRYIVFIRSHYFAVVDGVVYDGLPTVPRAVVKAVYGAGVNIPVARLR